MDKQNFAQVPPVNTSPPVGTPPPIVEIIPPQTEPQQTPPSGKFSLSPKIMLIILAISIVVVIGSGIYLAQKSKTARCGGFGGLQCPAGYTCKLNNDKVADAYGECVKEVKNTLASSKPTPTPDPTASWKIYTDSDSKYSFKYPSEYSLTKNVDGPNPETINILNHNISWNVTSSIESSNCRGDGCPYTTSSQQLRLGDNLFTKIKGSVGAVGGNIPQNYVRYEIKIPSSTEVIAFVIHELPTDKSFQELLKQYPDAGRTLQEIPKNEIDILEKILSTFKFLDVNKTTNLTANWKVLKTFVNSKGNKKYVIQEAEKPYSSKTENIGYNQIYVSSSPEKTIQSVLIVKPEHSEHSYVSSNSPYISTNDGLKFLVFELLGPGDNQSFVLVDENGKDIRIDLSQMGLGTQIPGMYGLSFGKWIDNSTNFTIKAVSGNDHSYEAVFDASTGKQVGDTKEF